MFITIKNNAIARLLKKLKTKENKNSSINDLITVGWTLLPKAASNTLIDQFNLEVSEFRKVNNSKLDQNGFGKRIGLIHTELETAQKILMSKDIMSLLQKYFSDNPVLFGSLTFDIGSEQNAHHDSAFFYTQPDHSMVGVWIALEDIHPDSGPLFYVPYSHKTFAIKADQALESDPNLKQEVLNFRKSNSSSVEYSQLADKVYACWDKYLQKKIYDEGVEKVPALIKKGDIFVWHGWLVHGGLKRNNPLLSRKSIVGHFIAENSRMWNQYDFFLKGSDIENSQPIQFNYLQTPFGKMVQHPKAVIFNEGNDFYTN